MTFGPFIKVFFLLFTFSICQNPNIDAQTVSEEKRDQIDLSVVLKNSADYCKKLENACLYFVCLEKIKERIFYHHRPTPSSIRPTSLFSEKKYVYDYQLLRKEGRVTESRILIEEDGQKKKESGANLKTIMFDHKYITFGPVGILSESWQGSHIYKILKEENLLGKKTIVVDVTPKFDQMADHLFGKAWLDKNDFSVIKIEWDQASLGNFSKIQEIAKSLEAEPQITFISEYGIEKNGIRFPTRYFIREEYLHPHRGRFIRSETIVHYEDYKFFMVETEVRYEK